MKKLLTMQFVFVVATLMLPMITPSICHGFALTGPNYNEDALSHGSLDPAAGTLQTFNAGFRWSSSNLTYAFDSSFVTAFGTDGTAAVSSAFSTWDAAFGTLGAPGMTHFTPDPGFVQIDIESVALHEIGHALGLTHPGVADGSGLNFDKNGAPIASSGNEVMNIGRRLPGEVQRDLTQDDIDGFNHIYSTTNPVPALASISDFSTINTFGPGDLAFAEALIAAALGGTVGANIDIFALDLGTLGATTIRAETYIYGGAPTAGGYGGVFGIPYLGGFFDGIPIDMHTAGFNNPNHGSLLSSIDIVFNTNRGANLGVNPYSDPVQSIPEPGTLLLMASGFAGLLACRRKKEQN